MTPPQLEVSPPQRVFHDCTSSLITISCFLPHLNFLVFITASIYLLNLQAVVLDGVGRVGGPLLPRGHWEMPGDIFDSHNVAAGARVPLDSATGGVGWACSVKTRELLNTLPCTGSSVSKCQQCQGQEFNLADSFCLLKHKLHKGLAYLALFSAVFPAANSAPSTELVFSKQVLNG